MAVIQTYGIPGFSDPVSSLAHLLGVVAFLCLTPPLLRKARGDVWRVACLSVFAFSTVFLLSMSGVYHLLSPGTPGRAVFQRLDHGAIFVLIAGTFTPVHGILFKGAWRFGPLVFVWLAAAAGVTLKAVFFDDMAEWVGLTLYLGMGWLGLVSGTELWRRYGAAYVRPMAWGGLAYTAGAVLEFLRWPVLVPGVLGPHELFHAFVLAGVGLHWRFVYLLACGTMPPWRGVATEAQRLPAQG